MRKHAPRMSRGLAIAMALLSTACYSYVPVNVGPSLSLDTRVAAELTARATADHETRIGSNVERVVGMVARTTTDSVELSVQRTFHRGGHWTIWGGETVAFGRNDFATLGERQFSRSRTALALGAIVAAIAVLISTDLIGFGDSDTGSDPRPIPPVNPG